MRYLHVFLLAVLVLTASCSSPGASTSPTPTVPTAKAATPAAPTASMSTPNDDPVTTQAGPTTAASETFENPVIRTNFPDPFILAVDGTYYAYATNGPGGHVQMSTSTDLVHWAIPTEAMSSLAVWIDLGRPDVWAPEVIQVGDHYNLYYTARDKASGKQCVGVATSSTPAGKFKDTREAALVCQTDQGGSIDANPFRDGDTLYLLFKNDGNCCGYPTYIYIQQMDTDGLNLIGEPVKLIGTDQPWEGHLVEAPTMFVYEGRYYLFFSANDYGGVLYAVGYANCETVTGPCTAAPENPILKSQMTNKPFVIGPGHQSIITVHDKTWIVYHAWNMTTSGLRGDIRQVYIDPIIWENGQPVVQGPTTGPQPIP